VTHGLRRAERTCCVKKVWLRPSTTSPSQKVTTDALADGTLIACMLPHTYPCVRVHMFTERRMHGTSKHTQKQDFYSGGGSAALLLSARVSSLYVTPLVMHLKHTQRPEW